MSLNHLLKTLEDTGEVNIQLAEHSLNKDESGNFTPKPLENVCFALDPVKKKKKKAKVPTGQLEFDWKFQHAYSDENSSSF